MECLVKNTNKSLISNRLPAGTIFYWAGKMNTKPEWALFCNGDSFPIPTSEEDEMWDLYQVIGTTYNKASGSGYADATPAGHFSIPDFIRIVENGEEKQVGLFIRSATNDGQVGVKQNDAIRNITGWFEGCYQEFNSGGFGSFYKKSPGNRKTKTGGWDNDLGIYFSANVNTNNYGNPMAGHAAGDDIHPYDIQMLPLIAY